MNLTQPLSLSYVYLNKEKNVQEVRRASAEMESLRVSPYNVRHACGPRPVRRCATPEELVQQRGITEDEQQRNKEEEPHVATRMTS